MVDQKPIFILNIRQNAKLRVMSRNNDTPVYGITIPRQIALNFLHYGFMNVQQSGGAILITPVENGN